MANKRSKRKLTSKQATHISWLVTLIFTVFMIIKGISSKPTGDEWIYMLVFLLLGSLYVFLIFYIIVLKVPDRISEERLKKIEIKNSRILSSTNFTQVYFYPKDTGGTIDIVMTILKNEGCIFYAKLDGKLIHLIAKDKYNVEVFNEKIENHLYFTCNFKIQE